MNRAHRERFQPQIHQEQRWMISYADFITLLFAFFAFLFSISTLQDDKFDEVSATLLQLFDVKPTSTDPIELLTTPQGPDVFNPLYQPEPLPGTDINVASPEKFNTQSSLLDIRAQMNDSFAQLIKDQLFSVAGSEQWIEIQIADSVTFLPGAADINDQAEAVLYEIGKLLADIPLPVSVEGYSLAEEETNGRDGWALSTERAVNVLRYLQQAGVASPRLSAVGFSHHQPKFSSDVNSTTGRISIVVSGFDTE